MRTAKKRDARAICLLLHELAEGEGRRCMQSEQSVTRDLLGKDASMQLIVAEARGEVVGLVCYYSGYDIESASRGNHLADIIVMKQWRDCGIGKALMCELARRTLAAQGEWVSWTVLRSNRRALRFYKRLGGQSVALNFMAMGRAGLKSLAEN